MKKTVTIHPQQTIGTPDPRMWGIFYEEINHAGDGGIYAELLRNRSFADARLPENTTYAGGKVHTRLGHIEDFDVSDPLPGWKLLPTPGMAASMQLTRENPRNPACAEQLELDVLRPAGGVRVVNEGYCGIPVKEQDYYGYVIARGEGITHVTVGLMYSGGVVICETQLSLTEEFQKLPFRFASPVRTPDARFFLQADEAGSLYVDFATLFPQDTDLGRPYGFRRDLMDMLRGLRPGFLRFPGGCVVEGINWRTPSTGSRRAARWRTAPATGICGATAPRTAWACWNSAASARIWRRPHVCGELRHVLPGAQERAGHGRGDPVVAAERARRH